MIRLAIVDDDRELSWKIYESVLTGRDDMEIVHRAYTMHDFLAFDMADVDLALVDGSVDRTGDGYTVLDNLRTMYPDLRTVLSSFAPDYKLAIKHGAVTTWTKDWFRREYLPGLIHRVMDSDVPS